MAKVETIKIEGENGPVVINKADFDPAKHTEWSDIKVSASASFSSERAPKPTARTKKTADEPSTDSA